MSQALPYPITETTISRQIGRTIHSPIYVGSLRHVGLRQDEFIQHFKPFFTELPWDPYDARRLQVAFLKEQFPKEATEIQGHFKDFYVGKTDLSIFERWTHQLYDASLQQFTAIRPWRRRSVAQFRIESGAKGLQIEREKVEQFSQDVDGDDYRSLPRIFAEAPAKHVENDLFFQWIEHIYHLTKRVRSNAKNLKIVAHFMSVQALPEQPGDNSPEGAHEDGADYIISALVIRRQNLQGGESQILEQRQDGNKEIIFRHELQEGEFIFQGDSRDEIVHGTDLWHHVTPFSIANPLVGEGWRDIIGFDIDLV